MTSSGYSRPAPLSSSGVGSRFTASATYEERSGIGFSVSSTLASL